MTNKFNFYEIVRVVSQAPELSEVFGKEGIVIGMSQCEMTHVWGYAVDLFDDEDGWDFMETDLESTNRFGKREDVYIGKTVKLVVDPETDEGTLVDEGE